MLIRWYRTSGLLLMHPTTMARLDAEDVLNRKAPIIMTPNGQVARRSRCRQAKRIALLGCLIAKKV